ncbi:MAG TPA: L,D-transpeptidase family protein [Frankiaceae bacterium]|nr:L,D-transpeptidase family protein [Frankiaceae bacterium]
MTRLPAHAYALAVAAVLAAGCAPPADPVAGPSSGSGTPSVPATPPRRHTFSTPRTETFPAYAADAKGSRVPVFSTPGGRVLRTFADPQPSGAPLVFLLAEEDGDWLKVHLPARPNGSTGWVRRRDVVLRGVTYRVDVLRGAHELRLYDREALVRTFPVAIGTGNTPTPGGTFYLKELLKPPNPQGDYGPYAYGLSGFSNVLTSFNGGDGVIGIHGTNDPSSIGKDVSHGCIRLRNADVTYLAQRLPLGTPVRILP